MIDDSGVLIDVLYNGVLLGSAALCLARAALQRPERAASAVMGLALALWAGGNL